MIKVESSPGRRYAGTLFSRFLILPALLMLAGCSHLKFNAYENMDDWYAAREDTFDIEDVGIQGIDGSFGGYVVNDLVIRSPVYAVYDLTRLAVSPIAWPYYTYKYVARGFKRRDPPAVEVVPDRPESPDPVEQ